MIMNYELIDFPLENVSLHPNLCLTFRSTSCFPWSFNYSRHIDKRFFFILWTFYYHSFPPHDIYAGKNCLHVASLLGYVEIVETLLRAGADVDAKTIDSEQELMKGNYSNFNNNSGKTAYQLAEESGNPRSEETMRVLMSYASTRVVASGGKLESKAAKVCMTFVPVTHKYVKSLNVEIDVTINHIWRD